MSEKDKIETTRSLAIEALIRLNEAEIIGDLIFDDIHEIIEILFEQTRGDLLLVLRYILYKIYKSY